MGTLSWRRLAFVTLERLLRLFSLALSQLVLWNTALWDDASHEQVLTAGEIGSEWFSNLTAIVVLTCSITTGSLCVMKARCLIRTFASDNGPKRR